ncbi:MAG: YggT family protein [Acidimicrobiales bacterium]
MINLIRIVLQIYLILLFGRIVLSWFPPPQGGFMVSLQRFLFNVTEPVLAPLRAILPPVRMGGMALDLSPTVLILVIFVLLSFLH